MVGVVQYIYSQAMLSGSIIHVNPMFVSTRCEIHVSYKLNCSQIYLENRLGLL